MNKSSQALTFQACNITIKMEYNISNSTKVHWESGCHQIRQLRTTYQTEYEWNTISRCVKTKLTFRSISVCDRSHQLQASFCWLSYNSIWYDICGLAGDLHVLEFQLSPLTSPSYLAAAKSRTVWHSGISLPRMSWKEAIKMILVVNCSHANEPFAPFALVLSSVRSDMLTRLSSMASSLCMSCVSTSAMRWHCSGLSRHNVGKSLIACLRIYNHNAMLSSSVNQGRTQQVDPGKTIAKPKAIHFL